MTAPKSKTSTLKNSQANHPTIPAQKTTNDGSVTVLLVKAVELLESIDGRIANIEKSVCPQKIERL